MGAEKATTPIHLNRVESGERIVVSADAMDKHPTTQRQTVLRPSGDGDSLVCCLLLRATAYTSEEIVVVAMVRLVFPSVGYYTPANGR